MKISRIAVAVASLSFIASGNALAAADQWEHAIGTGLFGLNIKGDQGLTVAGRTVEMKDFKLDSSQVQDYMDSAFGFGGASTKGDWKIAYKYAQLKLEDENNSVLNSIPASGKVTFDAASAELAGVYTFARNNLGNWGALGGLRYASQEIDVRATVGALPTQRLKRDENWTDVTLGLTHEIPVGKDMKWHSQIDAGIGDGNSLHFNTGLGWRFAKAWSADFYYDYKHYDYENSHRGSADWYLYDAAEYGVGASIAYHF